MHPNLNEKKYLEELTAYSLENLKNLEFAPNVDFNLPEELSSEENNEIRSNLIRKRDDPREYDDYENKN